MPDPQPGSPQACKNAWEAAVAAADAALLSVLENPNSTTAQRAAAWATWDAQILAAKEAFQNCAGRPA